MKGSGKEKKGKTKGKKKKKRKIKNTSEQIQQYLLNKINKNKPIFNTVENTHFDLNMRCKKL